jgi:hypothetical protein
MPDPSAPPKAHSAVIGSPLPGTTGGGSKCSDHAGLSDWLMTDLRHGD